MNLKGKEEIEKVGEGEGEVEDIYRDKEKVSQFQFSDRLLYYMYIIYIYYIYYIYIIFIYMIYIYVCMYNLHTHNLMPFRFSHVHLHANSSIYSQFKFRSSFYNRRFDVMKG